MAADTDSAVGRPPTHIYINGLLPVGPTAPLDSPIDPTLPPGFVLDGASAPAQAPVPPPPPGFVTDPMTGFSDEVKTDEPGTNHPRGLPTAILQYPYHAAMGVADLAKRAIENSQESLDTGNYDPSAPVESALLTMGTGAVAGVKPGGVVLGAGPIRRTPAVTSPPPPAGYVLDGTVKSLSDDLQTLRQSAVADRAEIGNAIRALPAETKDPVLGEKLYHAAEDPAELARLTPEERALFNQHLEPLRQEQFDLALEAKKLGGQDLVDNPDFMHRIAKGHAPEYDNLSGGNSYDPITGTRGLSRTTSALQSRKFYAIESPTGTRKVITPYDGGVTVWNNRTRTKVATAGEVKPGEVIDLNGQQWKVTDARTKEIEQHGLFTNKNGQPIPAKYHKNAFVNTADAVVRLREVVRNLKFVDEVKKSSWWLNHAVKAGGNQRAPAGWVEPKMPQFKGWKVDPKIANVLDDFYKPGLLDPANALRKANQFATSSMFWNPIGHMQNVGVHWAVARGWDWIRPGPMRHFATDMTRAIKETVTQGPEYQRWLREGGGLVYGGVKNADFYGDLGRHMGMQIEKNWSQYQPLFKKLGISKPAEAVAWWYSKMRNVLWATSDMFMMHRYLELERKGFSPQRALHDAEKHIPNYRIPSEIMGSRFASQVAQEPGLTVFSRYHYGMWKSFMHMATDLAKGTPAEKKEALGNVAALAFMGYVVYPVVNAIYQKITGDPNAKMLARGAMSVPHGLAEVSRDRQSFSQFLGSNITMAPATKEILQQFFGKDAFTGNDIGDVPSRVEHAAKALVSPYGTTAQVTSGGENTRSLGRTALDTIVGGENTSEKTEKGKQYGAVVRQRAVNRRRNKPAGPIERGYNAVESAIGLAPPPKEPKKKGEKRSHHNKEKGY